MTVTGSREEALAFKAVIDWLNGDARAFTDKENNIEIKAWWITGNVAMNAKSYLGTMAIAVATTRVKGLKTIIPEAAISNWYEYYRSNGLNLPALGWQGDDLDILAKYCMSRAKNPIDFKDIEDKIKESQANLLEGEDRNSGNYNRFWDERNYLNWIDEINIPVFIIHGINDWNVKTNQCIPLYEELTKKNKTCRMHLHQGEHVYIYNLKDSQTLSYLDRWLDYYLKDIETGITEEPLIRVQSNIDQENWLVSDTWPVKDFDYIFPIHNNGEITIIDELKATKYDYEKDNTNDWLEELVLENYINYKDRVKYIWDLNEFNNKDVRYSGKTTVEFEAAINKPTAILSAMLVDIGSAKRIAEEEIQVNDEYIFGTEDKESEFRVITRNSMNAQNKTNNWSKEEIIPGEFYKYSFDLVPTDYTIKAGHKLALIIYGIDAEQTQRPETVTEITIKQDSIKVNCPLLKL